MGKYVNVERIEFIITYRCNSHCKHCQLGEGKRGLKPASISSHLAARIVKEVTTEYSPTSIMTFGGEPLLFPDVVCAIHEAAKVYGISRREIITNTGYPRSETEFRVLANRLAESGLTDAAVSVDSFHQEYIPISVIEHNVQALLDAGISVGWDPCWVVSAKHENIWNERTWEILDELAHLAVPAVKESDGNIVEPEGNALKWLSDFMPSKSLAPKGVCEDVPFSNRLDKVNTILIEPDGNISVCKEFPIGNAEQRDVADILQNYDPYEIPEMKTLLQGGISKLAEFARERGVESDPGGYYSICDKCIDLRHKLGGIRPN